MPGTTEKTIDPNSSAVYGQLANYKEGKLTGPKYIRQEPYVDEEGIHVPVNAYVQEGCASVYRCVMTKEMFVEAYNKYINKPKRRYKGGWGRRKR